MTGPQDPIARLLAAPPALPVVAGLERLRALLAGHDGAPAPAVIVTAPPGTGKTTLVPPLVADVVALAAAGPGADGAASPGRVIVTQPRRVAARAAARRLAGLLGEEVGRTVGYAVRGERRAGPGTRIEIVTAGLLLRRLQSDPELPGVAAVVLDEVHERSLDSDLLLALLLDARAALREDLVLVAMSATLDVERLPRLLGGEGAGGSGAAADAGGPGAAGDPDAAHGPGGPSAPVLDIPSALHPITEEWAPPPSSAPRLGPRGVPREFLAHVAATTERALAVHPGDALVFLPGAREVDDVVSRLRGALPASGPGAVDVLPLHGRLPGPVQDAALSPSAPGRRRVVVATNVAESSLTVPGVRIVVDSTLAREPRLDVARGMSGLVTVGESRAAGTQRAGRAGREASGVVVRCCSPADWARAAQAPTPEILSADLTRTALELAAWGVPGGTGLGWIDAPPAPAMAAAQAALIRLGLAGEDGSITPLGRAVAGVPAEVREATALLAAAGTIGARAAAEATALLTADLRAPGGDLTALALQVGSGKEAQVWRAEAKRLDRAAREAGAQEATMADGSAHAVEHARSSSGTARPGSTAAGHSGRALHPQHESAAAASRGDAVGLVAALARPEWIARRRGPAPAVGQDASYATVGGTGLRVPRGSALAASEWLAVADVDRAPGRGEATVRAAAPINEELALVVGRPWLVEEERAVWEDGRVRGERVRRLGAIELAATPTGAPEPTAVARAVVEACRRDGLGVLPWTPGRSGDEHDAATLRARLALLHRVIGAPWPSMEDTALLDRAEEWLVPAIERLARERRRVDLGQLRMLEALRALLPWPEAARLDELAPERIEVPSGSHVRLSYLGDQGEELERPVLAVRVQECFGWATTPTVVDGRVPVLLHLLSPARRPVAVTDDLRSFWEGPYQEVRREMRGRYPKHPWPEDPWTEPATSRTKRR